jgi:hypothetical protein
MADALLRSPVVTPHVSRSGARPWRGQWLDARSTSSVVTTVKLAEEGEALVLRGIELEGRLDRLVLATGAVDVRPRGMTTSLLDPDGVAVSDGLERRR